MSLVPKLRRIALNQQGLLRADAFGRGKQATLRAIEQLGYVQIDTISVVERAHHHVLWSRVGNYSPRFLDQLVRERKVFEYWFHAAAWLPMTDYRFALPRMAQMNGERGWFKDSDQKLKHEILARITSEGPLRARDFEDVPRSNTGWWDWKPAKQALEQLFMQGELMISAREGFQKVYDLPERVLPDWVDTHMPDLDEYADYLVDTTLRAHGFASLVSMTYLRKGQKLREAVKRQLMQRIEDGSLTSVTLNSSTVYIDPELLDSRAPRCLAQVRILSPFDNTVIQRRRSRDLFTFDYQIECYVPKPLRQFGYFCLPIMYRDRLVGRVDCKAHRAANKLEVRSLHIEHRVEKDFTALLGQALQSFATFNHCDQIHIQPDASSDYLSHSEVCL
ncbi:MAG: winged helix DNA-binding domain-containing protein [Gammaproteobacteria bacterium]|nr:winged helix DNA-binding domain-containing protein [Gammaproteobacteria bacterium]MDH3857077.1 winged helix DNA-binding domain-containing protein [Gammaproteobacteria bacterium]